MIHNYCDFKDMLYSIDSTIWVETATKMLRSLGCPINDFIKIESWSVNDFLYHEPSIINNLTYTEKLELNHINTISKIFLNECYKVNCFAIEINTTHESRTELSAEITIILSKILLSPSILIFKNNSAIVFTGTYVNAKNSSLEIFISEWFEYDMLPDKYYKLLEIDFHGDYIDYLYSISRSYQRYKESKTYVLYYWEFIKDEYDYVDDQTKFEIVRGHYREIYGYDYYEEFVINDYGQQEDDDDVEWTLLELELDSLNFDIEDDDDNNYNYEEYEEDYEDDYEEDNNIFNDKVDKSITDNPENMLEFIRKRKAGASN